MDAATQHAITEAADASREGRIDFAAVVRMLVEAGVESYHVDYRAGRTTYYTHDDDSTTLDLGPPGATIAQSFDAAALQAAIRGAQRGIVKYPEFKRLSQAAGCVSYTVWLGGRHVAYHGRNGETHVERFPD